MRRYTRRGRKYELGRYLSSIHWPFLEDVESCEVKLQLLVDLITVGVDSIMPLKRVKLHWLPLTLKIYLNLVSKPFQTGKWKTIVINETLSTGKR
jgi:hypothetical protein